MCICHHNYKVYTIEDILDTQHMCETGLLYLQTILARIFIAFFLSILPKNVGGTEHRLSWIVRKQVGRDIHDTDGKRVFLLKVSVARHER